MSDAPMPSVDEEIPEKSWYGSWLPRLAAATIVVATMWFGSIWVFSSTSDFLLTLLISAFIALALLPGVEKLAARGWKRGAAAGAVMAIFFAIAIVFIVAMASLVVGQITQLVDKLPTYADQVTVWLNDTFSITLDIDGMVEDFRNDEAALEDLQQDVLGGVLGLASSAVGIVFQALTIGLFVFYLLADLPRLRGAINRRFPQSQQNYMDTILDISIDKVGGWVYSRCVLAGVSALFHFVVFWLLGLPYALAMALWVGVVSQFVPTVGTYLAGVVPFVVALLEDPVDAIWVLVAVTIYQQIENYAISPKITANTMDLHPAVAFGSAIVGANLLGGIGALIALPFAAAVTAVIQTYTTHYDLIKNEKIESPEEYEARMAEKEAAKAAKREGKRRLGFGSKRNNSEDGSET